ncbi:hypothetical protein [Paenirhodobacter sp. CAU 1674]|uniref:hypothetical protein n=1 Tax=Paenirhodobacter sp. CAU 1674 TaxID=3032596 RepID=UPI0023DB5343|nr:hypothetical protein [Paenirhodobacter sp. CAU 1674]MDF2143200.1 hypothetical protein [Paenirhodobacter sp. CAU 1674]
MADATATSMIVSQAFRYMELAPVSSFADDSDKARDAAQMYPLALRQCLEAGDWSFASVMVALPPLSSLPVGLAEDSAMPYVFRLPGDFVRLQSVSDGDVTYRLDKGMLLRADAPGPLTVRYTAGVDNEAILPARFRLAVAARLAAYLAPIHMEVASKIERIEALADKLLKEALNADNGSASARRYDGRTDGGFWADEVQI